MVTAIVTAGLSSRETTSSASESSFFTGPMSIVLDPITDLIGGATADRFRRWRRDAGISSQTIELINRGPPVLSPAINEAAAASTAGRCVAG